METEENETKDFTDFSFWLFLMWRLHSNFLGGSCKELQNVFASFKLSGDCK